MCLLLPNPYRLFPRLIRHRHIGSASPSFMPPLFPRCWNALRTPLRRALRRRTITQKLCIARLDPGANKMASRAVFCCGLRLLLGPHFPHSQLSRSNHNLNTTSRAAARRSNGRNVCGHVNSISSSCQARTLIVPASSLASQPEHRYRPHLRLLAPRDPIGDGAHLRIHIRECRHFCTASLPHQLRFAH